MQNISSWILSIVGICVLSVVIDLILPSGKTNSNIKKVVSYAIVLVVLMPIPALLKSDINWDNFLTNNNVEVQDNYIYNLNQSKLDDLKESIEVGIKDRGILGTSVSISANVFEPEMEIFAIYVDLYNIVISEDVGNINIRKTIKDVVLSNVFIEEDKIVFYE